MSSAKKMSKALAEIKSILSGTGTVKIPKLIRDEKTTPGTGSVSDRASKPAPRPFLADTLNNINNRLKLSPKIEPKFKAKLKSKADQVVFTQRSAEKGKLAETFSG